MITYSSKTSQLNSLINTAVFSIPEGSLLDGNFPIKQSKMLQAWIAIHEDALMADWKLAIAGKELFKIDPMK